METTAISPMSAGSISVRMAEPADLAQLQALLDRCSADTQYRRFHGAVGHAVRRELERIATPVANHRSWVATDGTAIHGTATLATGSDGAVEAAFLVEDAWFRRGLGRALFAALARDARHVGIDAVTAWVQADNETARRFLRSMAPAARTAFAGGGELQIDLPVITQPASRVDAIATNLRESA
jgi:GNAT superfamily N-acetyltransferase